ncbi:MAG: InlB B-repeat-containing protein, partial [Treponema sp.]|nr:InlB B-repeat-containing protein [Treponema sp.]
MKKTIINRVFTVVFAAAALFTNISCNQLTGASNKEVTSNEELVKIKPSVDVVSRTIFPDISTDSLSNLSLSFKKGTLNGTIAVYDDYKAFKKAEISLKPGTYEFTLTAKAGGTFLQAIIPSKKYEASAEIQPLDFLLSYNLAEAIEEGNGEVYFRFDYAKNKEIKEATIKFYKYDEKGNLPQYTYNELYLDSAKSNEDGSHYIEYYLDWVESGIYEIQMELKADDSTSAFFHDTVYVTNGCVTRKSCELKEWADKYVIASAIYTSQTKHFTAEPTDQGILITAKYFEDEEKADRIIITEDRTQTEISLWEWQWGDYQNPANGTPNAEHETVSILYPFTTAGESYIFNFVRAGENFWDTSETVIVKATADGISIFDEDYENRLNRYKTAGISVSDSTYEVKLGYDVRKLYKKVDSSIFDTFNSIGEIFAGDKSWQEGKTTNSTVIGKDEKGNDILKYHRWVGDVYESWEGGELNLLSSKGVSTYNALLNGIEIPDPLVIENVEKLGSYWAKTYVSFQLKGNPVIYTSPAVESEVTAKPEEERITITYITDVLGDVKVEKSYKKGINLELLPNERKEEQKFAGWYADKAFEGEPLTVIETTEDLVLYPKWNHQVNNWNYINKGKFSERDNYYTNFDFAEYGIDYKNLIKDATDPVMIVIKGTSVTDYEGSIHTHLVDYYAKPKPGDKDAWNVKDEYNIDNVSYAKGEEVTLVLKYVPDKDGSVYPYDENGWANVYISAKNKDNRDIFELENCSMELYTDIVKLTCIDKVSGAKTEAYYREGTVVPLPKSFGNYPLILNSWHKAEDFSDDAITEVTLTDETEVYAKMDLYLQEGTWINGETGETNAHYITDLSLENLRAFGCDTSKFPENYKLKKDDIVVLTISGTPKNTFRRELYNQVIDSKAGFVGSYGSVVDDEKVFTAGEPFTVTIETKITQTQF